MMHRIILFGAGRRCRYLLPFLKDSDWRCSDIVDSSPNLEGTNIEGIPVISPNRAEEKNKQEWCITVADEDAAADLKKRALRSGFSSEKILNYNRLMLMACMSNRTVLQSLERPHTITDNSVSILFGCISGLMLGGIEARTMQLCNEMQSRGWDNIGIVSDWRGHEVPVPVALESHIIRTQSGEIGRTHLEILTNLIECLIDRLPCIVVTNKPDLLVLASYIVREYFPQKLKMISIIAGLTPSIMERYLSYGHISDMYFGVSRDIVNELIKRGISNETVFQMTVPFPCEKQLSREYSLDRSLPLRIGYAGRLDGMEGSQKRMDLLLRLMLLMAQRKVNFIFNVAGDGPVRKEMEEYISFHGLSDRVFLLGRIDKSEIPNFWQKQDVGVNLSDYEGRSISNVEAMGGGAVPIVTDVSGVREDIDDGVEGYIVPIGDVDSALKRIIYLESNRELLQIMGKRAHDRIWPKSRMDTHIEFWKRQIELLKRSMVCGK